ncbi:hypothetical protein OB08_07770 [Microbacterium sp. HJ5]
MLSCLPSGARHVLVDATALPPEWRGWDAATDGHVLGPLDLVRRPDGHDAVMPVCPERVADFLARRAADGSRLLPGEAVTLGVSILRGCAELIATPDERGEWWLTEAGRPVFAVGATTRPLFGHSAALLGELASAHHVWTEVIGAVGAPRPTVAELAHAEQALFELCEPLPLVTAATTPRVPAEIAACERIAGDGPAAAEGGRGLWHALSRHVDADLADLVSRATTGLWRRARMRGPARKAPLLMAGAAAVAVLAVGLWWPSGEEGAATARTGDGLPSPASVASPAPSASATSEPATPAPATEGGDDLVALTGALLDRRRGCGDESACLAETMLDPATAWPGGAVDLPGDQRTATLLDDFGGVAVLRVDASSGENGPQLVVIVRHDDEWLLRDVQDVAQQP